MAMQFDTRVLVNAQRLPDSPAAYETGALCVLDGLSISWGRSTQVDQPRPTTARFSLGAKGSAQTDITTGGRVDIYTRGTVQTPATATLPAPNADTRHPGTDLHPLPQTPDIFTFTPKTVWNTTLQADPAPPGDPSNPGAWDTIRQAEGGQWIIGAKGSGPAGATITLTALTWNKHTKPPTPSDAKTFTIDSTRTYDFRFTTTPPTGWVGIKAEITLPHQRAWYQMTHTWATHNEPWSTNAPDPLTITPYIISQPFTTSREILAFQGHITDATATTTATGTRVDIIAGDLLAQLGPAPVIGSTRPAEPAATRIQSVLTAAGITAKTMTPAAATTTVIAPATLDGSKALPLLQDCATATGTALYTTAHPETGQTLTYTHPSEQTKNTQIIDAAYLQQEGVTATQDLTDISTSVTVRYQENNTESAITMKDTTATTQIERTTEIKTELTTRPAAALLAAEWLDRLAKSPSWRINGLIWNSETGGNPETFDTALEILSAHTRPGLPITLTNLPAWLPAKNLTGQLEGGTYEYKTQTWKMALNLTLKERKQ